MKKTYSIKIDAYAHIAPQKYREALTKAAPKLTAYMLDPFPPLYDLDERFRTLDKYEVAQVLTPAWPAVEVASPKKAAELAKLMNDEMAKLVAKYPDRFPAAIACLPMNDMKAALKEVDRCIKELRFRGVLIYTPINDKPLESPEFLPLYEKMAEYNLPILIHPVRLPEYPDYRTEKESKYRAYMTFGWPFETTLAMTRLVFSGIMQKYPGLKVLTHHCGGMVPYLEERIKQFMDVGEMRRKEIGYDLYLTRPPIEYYKMFYNDTALYGNTAALMCGFSFCGADHLIFAVDYPLGDMEFGNRNYRQTINAIEAMDITDEDRNKIYVENAKKLYRLPI